MQASGLMDDSALETPDIIEIPLKDLGAPVKPEKALSDPHATAGQKGCDSEDHAILKEDDEQEGEGDKADQCLLGGQGSVSHSDLISKLSVALDTCSASSGDSPRMRSLSTGADTSSTPLLPLPPPPPLRTSSSSSSGSSSCKGARARKPREESQAPANCRGAAILFPSPARVRFSDSLPNGSLVRLRSSSMRHDVDSELDPDLNRAASDNFVNDRLENGRGGVRGDDKDAFDDVRNPTSSRSFKVFEPRDNHIVRSLLYKTRSYQDHLCCAESSLQDPESLESMSKEELLFLWKNSELELNRKLYEALREKARLEKKLALLQKQSPV